MDFEDSSIVLTKKDINKCVHKYEKLWYILLVIINIALIIGVIALCIKNLNKYSALVNNANSSLKEFVRNGDDSKLQTLSINALPIELQWFLLGLLSVILLPFIINVFYAK